MVQSQNEWFYVTAKLLNNVSVLVICAFILQGSSLIYKL